MSGFTEAIVFFKDNKVVKEMFFSEFEAVLDDVVGIPDFTNQALQAAFVKIDADLHVVGAVFFLVSFDETGKVSASWNIPLRHLMDRGSKGLDLGGGPIQLVCRSLCPVAWHKDQLWDPVVGDQGTFYALSKAIKKNRLGIVSRPAQAEKGKEKERHSLPLSEDVADVVPISEAVNRALEKAFQEKLASLKDEEKLSIATQAEAFRSRTDDLEKKYTKMLGEREKQIAHLKKLVLQAQTGQQSLQKQLTETQDLLARHQSELEAQVSHGDAHAQQQLDMLKEEYERRFELQLAEQLASVNQQMEQRERELLERSTQIVDIRAELRGLREQNQQLLGGDNKLIQEMGDKGIIFIAYHPGVEHLVIPPAELQEYLENANEYVAKRCEVDFEHYKLWLEHYHLPICRGLNEDGDICGEPIDKVLRPVLFRPGESDRCSHHAESLAPVE
ncbi:hypothetical protein IB286_08130 [Spongiibacter sp. KMU-158]|uniref:Chromosome partitioning protein ParA n=1 Tax=Spongiibacter pelagi TaxID=2760804 RepID=A0A927GWC3_9GAMM|nr:hypothetical protein [Spongiibacter pelagi]MBD2858978.1 hypothetical protein [Spongiibacter pelagi]